MRFFLYCACGSMGVFVDYAIFYMLVSFGLWYQLANTLSYASGTLVSFALNRIFTFNLRDKTLRRLLKFFIVAGIGYISSAILMWIMVENLTLTAKFAKPMTFPIVVLIQYLLNSRYSFSRDAAGTAL